MRKSRTIHVDWPSNVLHFVETEVVERQINFASDMLTHRPRYAHSARFGKPLYAGCHVHVIAINVIPVMNDLAQVDANSEL